MCGSTHGAARSFSSLVQPATGSSADRSHGAARGLAAVVPADGRCRPRRAGRFAVPPAAPTGAQQQRRLARLDRSVRRRLGRDSVRPVDGSRRPLRGSGRPQELALRADPRTTRLLWIGTGRCHHRNSRCGHPTSGGQSSGRRPGSPGFRAGHRRGAIPSVGCHAAARTPRHHSTHRPATSPAEFGLHPCAVSPTATAAASVPAASSSTAVRSAASNSPGARSAAASTPASSSAASRSVQAGSAVAATTTAIAAASFEATSDSAAAGAAVYRSEARPSTASASAVPARSTVSAAAGHGAAAIAALSTRSRPTRRF